VKSSGDRRLCRRYPLVLDVLYEIVGRGRVLQSGRGQSINISAGGILFETPDLLPVGTPIRLRVAWPRQLSASVGLQLEISGRTVRVEDTRAVVAIVRHEFLVRKNSDGAAYAFGGYAYAAV
jgi:hypothetical protein